MMSQSGSEFGFLLRQYGPAKIVDAGYLIDTWKSLSWLAPMYGQATAAEYVIALAEHCGIHDHPTPEDALTEITRQLAVDEVVTDEVEDLIAASVFADAKGR